MWRRQVAQVLALLDEPHAGESSGEGYELSLETTLGSLYQRLFSSNFETVRPLLELLLAAPRGISVWGIAEALRWSHPAVNPEELIRDLKPHLKLRPQVQCPTVSPKSRQIPKAGPRWRSSDQRGSR